MRRLPALIFALLAFVALSAPALAEKRVALVIGNNAYPNLAADKQLRNAIADARAMRDTLSGLGFEVIYGEDLDRRAMIEHLFDLAARLGKDDVAFFFFAGHGVSFSGANYLLPSDIPTARASGRAEEGRLAELAIAETTVVERITAAEARVAIIVLDACRNNPLQTADRRSVGESRGLLRPMPAKGVFSIYSAGFGQQALDRLGRGDPHPNSVFTRVFIEKLKTPGLDLRAVVAQTRREVVRLAETIDHEQIPAYYDQVIGSEVYLAGLPPPAATVGPSVPTVVRPDPCGAAEAHWRSAERMGSLVAFEDHLARFPDCAFAGLARARIDELKKTVAVVAPPVPAPAPVPSAQPVVVVPPALPHLPPDTAPKPAAVVPPSPPATPPAPTQPAVGTFPAAPGINALSPERERALKPKETFKECDTCPEMVVVPAGSFMMGSPDSEEKRDSNEGPQHRVTFARQFAVGKFAVTFDEWDACVADGGCNGYRPSDWGWGRGRRPAIIVSWDNAKSYVDWLSRKTGKGYRLLAEAEHEYVTRAGSTTVYWWGSSISTSQANYAGNTGEDRQKTLPVGTFQPNPWGLHELHGNISEWVEDCWNSNYVGAPNDGSAWKTGDCSYRSVRGGSWILGAAYLRSAVRGGAATVFRDNFLGFRVARTLDAVDTPAQRTEAPPPVQQAVVVPPVVPVPPAETAPKPAVGVYPTAREVTPLSPERERALKPKDTFKECDTCPEMVVVPAGSFTMGSAANEKYRDDDEGPQRVVTFSRKFAVGKLPVTWEEWNACVAERVCKDPGHDIKGHGARPATGLSWNDAKVYVAWLSKKTRKSYRLLSEAEREYVARAGTATPYWWGSLYDQSMTDRPNPWGLQRLYHEHREWVEDCYHKNYRGAPTDGSAWTTGACALRVLRGHIGTGLGRPCIGGRPRATQTASATAPTVSA